MSRFGKENQQVIRQEIQNITPDNTRKSKSSVWKQFVEFCDEKLYNIHECMSVVQVATILEDYAFNMKKKNFEDYKESVVKVMWNSTAKQLQEIYYEKYKIKFNPFSDVEFATARAARDAKRKKLQRDPLKRKVSASALTSDEYKKIIEMWDENTPDGLQRKFFHIVSHELAWRGGEGYSACIQYFKEETDNFGNPKGRIEYNPIFSKTTQGGSKKLSDSKWLITNFDNPQMCPVRLFKKLMEKRGNLIQTDRLFLTPNPYWSQPNSKGWYKNSPVGKNIVSSWFKSAASDIGIDTKKVKITNHSARATAVSKLAKEGVGEQQLIKITGHSNSQSIKPYLQLDVEHHHQMIESMRRISSSTSKFNHDQSTMQNKTESTQIQPTNSSQPTNIYNNCVFNINKTYNN